MTITCLCLIIVLFKLILHKQLGTWEILIGVDKPQPNLQAKPSQAQPSPAQLSSAQLKAKIQLG